MRFRAAIVLIPTLLTLHAWADQSILTLDPASSRVAFTLKATLHQVEGSFSLASGEIRFDPESGAASGRIVVRAQSGDTAKKKRDKKMHNTVLESVEHPEIVFEPTTFEGTLAPEGNSRLQVKGTMRLLGVAHPLELPVDVGIEGDLVRVNATFTVPYVEWGLKDPSAFVLRVGKSVDVTLDLMGRLDAGVAADSDSGP